MEHGRTYRLANPHKAWEGNFRERCRQLGIDPVIESFTKGEVIERWGSACFYCGGAFEHLDHYLPLVAGGPHTLENVRPACAKCNYAKAREERARA